MPDHPGGGWVATWPTSLLALIWLAWVFSWIIASFWSGTTKTQVRTLDAWVYRLPILLGAILLSPWASEAVGARPLYAVGNAVAYALVAVTLLGISFTWWARIHLGRFWSNAITQKEDHRIVDTGPYGLVRHPIYTGLIIALIATSAAIATWTALLGALLISFGEWRKARMEERFLSAELGPDAYASYCRRVPMIVPFFRGFG